MTTRFRKNQQGVVLLSCLIFLLLLLTILRYTMGSAHMEELKAGADYDQMQADSAAQLIMRDAEFDIQRRNVTDGSALRENGKVVDPLDYWSNDNVIARHGVYDGDANSNSTVPFYQTVDWSDGGCNDSVANGVICFGGASGAGTNNFGVSTASGQLAVRSNNVGKYIIERFKGNGNVLGFGPNNKQIILRVTAIGYSDFSRNGGHAGTNASNSVLQNTYILSRK